ncbi:MAG: hypothetical protein H8E12_15420 [Rhodobacteraceae bacterium]|nr:hypothetical protein [Paracoccaceae bacterium]
MKNDTTIKDVVDKWHKTVMVDGKEHTYMLTKPLKFKVKKLDDASLYSNDGLKMHILCDHGDNLLKLVGEELDMLWDNYLEEDDNLLTKNAIKLKERSKLYISARVDQMFKKTK